MNIYILGFRMNPLKNILTITTVLFFLSLFIIVLTTCYFVYSFNRLSFYEYDIILNHKMDLKNKENDIIIVGDSAALNGLIPNIIFNRTKLKTSNLALYANNGIYSYEILLKNYLKKNGIPKRIILYFSTISPDNWKLVTYEKSILIFRFASLKEKIVYILKNPYSVIILMNRSVRAILRYLLYSKNHASFTNDILDPLKRNNGFVKTKEVKKDNICKQIIPKFSVKKLKNDIENFKKKFENLDIDVYVAPVMECIFKNNVYANLYKGISDNKVYFLNEKYFTDFNHLNLEGAKENSSIFSEWILNK